MKCKLQTMRDQALLTNTYEQLVLDLKDFNF